MCFGCFAAEFFPDRTEVQCLHRWQKVLNPDLIKGPWTQQVHTAFYSFIVLFAFNFCVHKSLISIVFLQEDEKIIELVEKYGPAKWSIISDSLPGRIGKQCRER